MFVCFYFFSSFFFFNDTATTEIYTLSLQTLFRSATSNSFTQTVGGPPPLRALASLVALPSPAAPPSLLSPASARRRPTSLLPSTWRSFVAPQSSQRAAAGRRPYHGRRVG